jgi:hypothetical protein
VNSPLQGERLGGAEATPGGEETSDMGESLIRRGKLLLTCSLVQVYWGILMRMAILGLSLGDCFATRLMRHSR